MDLQISPTYQIAGEIRGTGIRPIIVSFLSTRLHDDSKHLCRCGTKVFFILALSGACALPAYTQENSWKELQDKATSLLQKKRYADGIMAGEEALKVAEKTFSSGDTRIADSMNLLGVLYRTYGRYTEPEPLFHQALAFYKK